MSHPREPGEVEQRGEQRPPHLLRVPGIESHIPWEADCGAFVREGHWVQHLERGLGGGEEEVGRLRSPQKGLSLPPQEALKLRRSQRIVPSWGKEAGPLDPNMAQALKAVCPKEGA